MQVAYRSHLSLAIVVLLCCTVVRAGNPAAVLDFDGDGKSDYVVVRSEIPTPNSFKLVWYINGSKMGVRGYQWGLDSWALVPADYDGDGKWDIAVWAITGAEGSPAYFHIYRSSDNTYQRIAWGITFDDPLQTQDFDGDGNADPTITRCIVSSGESHWYTFMSSTGQVRAEHFGFCGDRPLRGDFDGDGKADIAVYRINVSPEPNYFIIHRSSDNQIQFYPFGTGNNDHVFPADFDGDGRTDYAIVRLVDNKEIWYWVESSTGTVRARQFGHFVPNVSFDNPALGDYDGDGKTDLAIWRSSDFGVFQSHFYIARSRDGMFVMPWGTSRDTVPASTLQFR
jgi:hypothetical protein